MNFDLSTFLTPAFTEYLNINDDDKMVVKDFLQYLDKKTWNDEEIDYTSKDPWEFKNPNKNTCMNAYWKTTEKDNKEKNKKEYSTMNFDFGNMFNGMFKPIARGACKMGMNGKVAVRTSTGYKTYDIKKNKLTNCDSFAFDMDGAFWVVPTFKVECGDIILVNGKPRCVIAVGDTIKVFSYEDSTIDEVVPEHHVFMGKTYCYGKIFSPFMNMEKSDSAMSNMMNMMMMSQMFNGGNQNNMGFNPMMFMMMNNGGSNPFAEMFEGAFNFGEDTDKDEKEE